MNKICQVCGDVYEKNKKISSTQWSNNKYCSRKCSAAASSKRALEKRLKIVKNCIKCGSEYHKNKKYTSKQWDASKYCSVNCAGSSRRMYPTSAKRQEAHRRKSGAVLFMSEEHLKKLSINTKQAMYRPEVQEKIRQPRGSLTLEHRMKLSDALAGKMPSNMMSATSNSYSNIQRGYYDINGDTLYFRSKWEANYALYLDFLIDHKEILKWEFEPDTFIFEEIKLGVRSYTPDFKVFNIDGSHEYHEVKGYMDSKSKTKLKRFSKYYPDEKLVLIDSDQYRAINKQVGKLLKFY